MQTGSALVSAAATSISQKARRIDLIRSAPEIGRHLTLYRGSYVRLPIVRIAEEVLLYRAANGRLIAESEERARVTGQTAESLHESQADSTTQALLHELLLLKARDKAGPVLQELERYATQTEPLLISCDGVVINGNRRLAAMRELFRRDSQRYASFGGILAAVLPDSAIEADFEFLEAALQMAPDVKLAYGWINRRIKLRRQVEDLKLPLQDLLDAYRFPSEAELRAEIAEIELAEEYLSKRRTPGAFGMIAQDEPLFRGLRRQLIDLDPNLAPAWRSAAFAMIAARDVVLAPMDRYYPFAEPVPASLPEETLLRFAVTEGILDPDGGGASLSPKTLSAIEARVDERREEPGPTAQRLFGIMDEIRAEHREGNAPNRAIKQLVKAKGALGEIEIGRMSPKQLRRLQSELAAIQAQVAALLGDDRTAGNRQPAAGVIDRLLGRRG
ncbi:hypothetical protein ACIKTA_02730 [Hansschlegelia beijingensis]